MTNKHTTYIHVYGTDTAATADAYSHLASSVSGLPYDYVSFAHWRSRYPTAEGVAALLTYGYGWPFVAGDFDTHDDEKIVVVPEGRPGLFLLVIPERAYQPSATYKDWCDINGFVVQEVDESGYTSVLYRTWRQITTLVLEPSRWTVDTAGVPDAYGIDPAFKHVDYWHFTSLYSLNCDAKYAVDPARYDDPDVLATDLGYRNPIPEPTYFRIVLERLDGTKWTGGRGLLDQTVDTLVTENALLYGRKVDDAACAEALSRVLEQGIVASVLAYSEIAKIEGITPPPLRIASYTSVDGADWEIYDTKVISPDDHVAAWLLKHGYA